MTEYIDREELKANIIKRLGISSEKYLLPAERTLWNTIADIPAADVAPVRHGRWIEFPEVLAIDDTLENGYIGCSVCKDIWNMRDNDTERFEYCPNYGARMDGES